ncbi:MAG: hypothetical protein MUF85_01760 [Patescibacteria group bacterium]|jgi:hypothetical protein|nr:hypothetical protein [Patescibacteria group bacterium]
MTNSSGEQTPPAFEDTEPKRDIKLPDFCLGVNTIDQIPGIRVPLITELSLFFNVKPSINGDWSITDLGSLIQASGRSKVFTDNLPRLEEAFTGKDGVQIAIEWVEKSGLLTPVYRNFENPQLEIPKRYDHVLITGGVRNWMVRRAVQLIKIKIEGSPIEHVNLASGNRIMKQTEGDDVLPGDTESSYMERVIMPLLEAEGINCKTIFRDTESGSELADAIVRQLGPGNLLIICNAGNWIKNGGQIRRADKSQQLKIFVVSDSIPLAKNGEPPETHQNPLTAINQLARNLQELRHYY